MSKTAYRRIVESSLLLMASIHPLVAANYWFDGGTVDITANGNGLASATGNGNWNATVKNWDQGSSLAHVAWSNLSTDTAVFGGSNSRTVTVSGTVTAGTISMVNSGWIFSGGIVDTNIIDANGTGTTTFNSNLTGELLVNATGSTINLGSSAAFMISSDNSAGLTSTTLALNQDANHIILNNAGALGAAGASVKLTKGAVNLGNTAAVSTSYNAWNLELNGGSIRSRFGVQTLNGPVTVTADSWLLTRAANDVGQDAKLVFSSTATIDLGANRLSLHSAANPDNSGIELNGAISGTGGLTLAQSSLTGSGAAGGVTTLSGNNTYTGDTLVNNGTLALSSTGGLKFLVGANNVSNKIGGTGTVSIDGLFTFDLTSASTLVNSSWNIVDVANLNESFGANFGIAGFTADGGGLLWNGSANGTNYQFSEATGVLSVVPEPAAAVLGGFGMLTLLRRRRQA